MGKKSKLRQLPPELRKELDRLFSEDKEGVREIAAYLKERGFEISKSSVGREKKKFEAVAKHIRDSQIMAQAIVAEAGDQLDPNVGRLVGHSLQGLLLQAQREHVNEDGVVDLDALGSMAESFRNICTGMKSNVDAELKLRAVFAKEAASIVEKIAGERGVGADTLEAIKQGVLGIGKRTAA